VGSWGLHRKQISAKRSEGAGNAAEEDHTGIIGIPFIQPSCRDMRKPHRRRDMETPKQLSFHIPRCTLVSRKICSAVQSWKAGGRRREGAA